VPLTGDKKPFPFLATPAIEDNPEFSPDGRWIAYSSNASGREEAYVRPFPGPGGQYQVSRSSGTQPQWRGDGRELFFLSLDGTLLSASVTPGPNGFEAGTPQALFSTGVASRRTRIASVRGGEGRQTRPRQRAGAQCGARANHRRAELAAAVQTVTR